MLPDFLIIGAQKAGTSWLKVALQEHPDICMYRQGEIHFFDAYFDNGLDWYESHFGHCRENLKIGEKTPQYLSNRHAPERIHKVLGEDIKLLASIRHPVDRAYSQYWHELEHGRIPPNMEFREAYRSMPVLSRRGDYLDQFRRYWGHFPKESLLVLVQEEMARSPQSAFERCCQFLEVQTQPLPQQGERKVNRSKGVRVFGGPAQTLAKTLRGMPPALRKPARAIGRRLMRGLPMKRKYCSLDPAVRADLSSEWTPMIEELAYELKMDLSSVWL